MRLHYLLHASFESPGFVLEWANERGWTITSTHTYKGLGDFPAMDAFDLLVVMGGPFSVHDAAHLPWMQKEKAFIREAIDAKKKIVGICLGSQLIAEALGATVTQNKEKEIGWWPLQLTEKGKQHPLTAFLPADFTTFHWHGETFGLPAGAELLASSPGCTNQVMVFGKQVLCMQCHFEVQEKDVQAMAAHGTAELKPSAYVQDEKQLPGKQDNYTFNRQTLFQLLDTFNTLR